MPRTRVPTFRASHRQHASNWWHKAPLQATVLSFQDQVPNAVASEPRLEPFYLGSIFHILISSMSRSKEKRQLLLCLCNALCLCQSLPLVLSSRFDDKGFECTRAVHAVSCVQDI